MAQETAPQIHRNNYARRLNGVYQEPTEKESMKSHNSKIFGVIGVCIVVVTGIAALVILSNQRVNGAAMPPDWPPFQMTYEDWGLTRGRNESGGFIRVKLTYTDRYHWRTEILEDTGNPTSRGSTSDASPQALVHYAAQTQETSSIPIEPGQAYRPDDWLAPGLITGWIAKYSATVTRTETDGINQMTYTEQVPCDPDAVKCERDNLEVVVQAKYWAEHDVPMEIMTTRDGVLRRKITVTGFTWLDSANQ